MRKRRVKKRERKNSWLKKGLKLTSLWLLALILIFSQAQVFWAFEAHIINVTAEIKDNTPWAEPPGGDYPEPIEVELFTAEPGATILYTRDGSYPSCPETGLIYTEAEPIPIEEDTVLRAVACGLRGSRSGLMEEIYHFLPEVSEISPIADSYIYQGSPGSNYGSASYLRIRSKENYNRRTFLRFDFFLPPETTIDSSLLKLYLKYAPSTSRNYDAYRALESWIEKGVGGINWGNQPSVSGIPTDSIESGTIGNTWLSWDVTSDVDDFVSNAEPNYGWRLSDNEEDSAISYEGRFYSRESSYSNLRPILEVTFVPPEVTTIYPVINEVYSYVGTGKGSDITNEWVEIYNPTNEMIDISGWQICDRWGCDIIPASTPIPAKGFAVITPDASTFGYWSIPEGAIEIVLGSFIGSNGLGNYGDRVILKDAFDTVVDAMSYGSDTSQLNPSVPNSGKGKSLARIIKGYDTNSATDWIINATPNPGTNPSENGFETITIASGGVEFEGSQPVPEEEFIEEGFEEEEPIEEGTTTEENFNFEETTDSTDETPAPDTSGVDTGTNEEESVSDETTEESTDSSENSDTPSEEGNTDDEAPALDAYGDGTGQATDSESPTTENTETGTETPASEENNNSNNSEEQQIDSAPPAAEENPSSLPSSDSGNSSDASGTSDGSSSDGAGSGEGVGGIDGGSSDSSGSTADIGQSSE